MQSGLKYLEACETDEVIFNWHGGEALILGLDFYKRAAALQKKFAGKRIIHNTLQTNGTLLTDDWARFLHDENWLTGISIDGPRDVHDKYRKDKFPVRYKASVRAFAVRSILVIIDSADLFTPYESEDSVRDTEIHCRPQVERARHNFTSPLLKKCCSLSTFTNIDTLYSHSCCAREHMRQMASDTDKCMKCG